ncbi:MAG: ABC transporter ATP-binding protein [Candidatus Cloacimonetes bacterium]|jgi:lipoprotein-releasing system ATP-binding protein|nr:ABC transporter ATP-binding protein [Candidatus Cloacimonadota bacterium]
MTDRHAGRVVLAGRGLVKRYTEEDGSELVILDGVDIEVSAGEAVAIVGASGAGKSTLLHLLGCLDRPTAGTVLIEGRAVDELDDRELAAVRNRSIGFVFQFHHLLREFTALENVMMPQLIAGVPEREAAERAHELLRAVGLAERTSHRSSQLSGGEQQRVAVARALANEPAVLIADEPSGNLDTHTSEQLHALFFELRRETGVALVLATHNRELAEQTDRILLLKEGHLRSNDSSL